MPSGGQFLGYYRGTLPPLSSYCCSLKIRHPEMKSTSTRSSKQLQWLEWVGKWLVVHTWVNSDYSENRVVTMPTLSSLVAPQVVVTTCGATSDDKVGIMITLDCYFKTSSENATVCVMTVHNLWIYRQLRTTWWRHQMTTFFALLALCAGNSPVTSEVPSKVQWRGALMFSLICAWINGWINSREAGDLRRHRAHYDVIVMTTVITPVH